jgi:hypothetical protein
MNRCLLKIQIQLGMEVHTCNPCNLEAEAGESQIQGQLGLPGMAPPEKQTKICYVESKRMQLENIMLNEVSQEQKYKRCVFSLIHGR